MCESRLLGINFSVDFDEIECEVPVKVANFVETIHAGIQSGFDKARYLQLLLGSNVFRLRFGG